MYKWAYNNTINILYQKIPTVSRGCCKKGEKDDIYRA